MHFLLFGAVLFAAFGWRSGRIETGSTSIFITQGRIANLASGFTLTRMRPPSHQEMDDLIREYVHEEVAVREALALGLDSDDQIIRRRLRQKLEFVSQDLAALPEPSDSELQAYLTAHPAALSSERRFSFRQVYLDSARHGVDLSRDAVRLRDRLRQAGARAKLGRLGDPIMLPHDFESASARNVANDFGGTFATALEDLPTGQWEGPVASGYGVHIVLLTARTDGGVPSLGSVRDAVRLEWQNAKRREASDQFYRTLLQRYSVSIESLSAANAKPDSAGPPK